MPYLNKVMLMGHLGKDPEVKYTQSGKAVATLSVATTDYWTDESGNQQEKTEWHRVIAWDKLAQRCAEYLTKGSAVLVEGKLVYRTWVDNKGQHHSIPEINAKSVMFLNKKKQQIQPPVEENTPF